MGDWDSTRIGTEAEALEFNRALAVYSSPLIKVAVEKAGKEILTPANLKNFLSSPADLYKATIA